MTSILIIENRSCIVCCVLGYNELQGYGMNICLGEERKGVCSAYELVMSGIDTGIDILVSKVVLIPKIGIAMRYRKVSIPELGIEIRNQKASIPGKCIEKY